jgi:acyl-CoA thioesterase
VAAPAAPDIAGPEQSTALPEIEGVTPRFIRHFDLRWSAGPYPYTGGERGFIDGWVRFRESTGYSVAHLLALVDAWPPAVIGLFERPAPSSSLTWSIEFMDEQTSPSPWWRYHASTDYAADGYAHTEARLWHDDGRLVAISRQTVAAFG